MKHLQQCFSDFRGGNSIYEVGENIVSQAPSPGIPTLSKAEVERRNSHFQYAPLVGPMQWPGNPKLRTRELQHPRHRDEDGLHSMICSRPLCNFSFSPPVSCSSNTLPLCSPAQKSKLCVPQRPFRFFLMLISRCSKIADFLLLLEVSLNYLAVIPRFLPFCLNS